MAEGSAGTGPGPGAEPGSPPVPERIESARNPVLKLVRSLISSRRRRQELGLSVLEGVRLAREAVDAGLGVEVVLCADSLAAEERGRAVLRALAATGARTVRVPDALLERLADTVTPQGLLAAFRIPRARLEDLSLAPAPGAPAAPLLVADGLQDPGNLGTLLRSAHAFGSAGAVVTGAAADPWAPKVVRAAMGSLFRLPVAVEPDNGAVADWLRRHGVRVLTADPRGALLPWEVDWTGPVAVVIGSEARGPSPELDRLAAVRVRIPMPGGTESLNAAIAGSLLLYEALRRRAT